MNFFAKLGNFARYCWQDFRNKVYDTPSGIWVYCSDAGSGKTISAIEYLQRVHKIYPNVKIYSNINLNFQDGKVSNVAELLSLPKNSVIFWDELNVLLNSHDWQKVDPRFRIFLSQHRHLEKQLISTAQSFNDINAEFRRFCTEIIEVRNLRNRWIFQRSFHREDYKLIEGKDNEYVAQKVRWCYNFIATDDLRNSYDHKAIVNDLVGNMVI